MDIQVGDRITYKNGHVELIQNNENLKDRIENCTIEVVKIERPKYEIVEEKEELLTEEEKEFLKNYVKLIESLNNGKVDTIINLGTLLVLHLKTSIDYYTEIGSNFKDLKKIKYIH